MNFLAIIGVIGTCLGFYFTYHQIKIMNDRIENYEKFYYWIDKLIEEIRNKQAKTFYFFGSTILPGNMSLAHDKDPLKTYRSRILALFKKDYESEGAYDHIAEAIMVLPDTQGGYEDTYEWFYKNKTLDGWSMDENQWKNEVDEKKNNAKRFQEEFQKPDNLKFKRKLVEINKGIDLDYLKREYVFMNGIRVVYGIPTHYGGSARNEPAVTHLVGFTTTNTEIIKAFRQKFDSLIKVDG